MVQKLSLLKSPKWQIPTMCPYTLITLYHSNLVITTPNKPIVGMDTTDAPAPMSYYRQSL